MDYFQNSSEENHNNERVENEFGYQESTSMKVFQNTPNPFTDQTIIGFDLPQEMEAEIVIHNSLGAVVKRINGKYTSGYNSIEVSSELMESGVYYYTLRTETYSATKNMIIVR